MTDSATQDARREANRRYYAKKKAEKALATDPAPIVQDAPPRLRQKISDVAINRSRRKVAPVIADPFIAATPPPGVVPAGAGMAMDSFGPSAAWAAGALGAGVDGFQAFLGYPMLAELAQRPEYRRISETIATEMTRKWVEITAAGDGDKTEQVKAIEVAMVRLNVKGAFKELAEQDGFFGRSHLYIDLGATDDPDELKTPIGDGRNSISQSKVEKGGLKRLKTVEAVWCYPADYNSNDPLRPDWFKPSMWFVQGKQVHASRLLTFVGREVPDLLKPAYSFGGLSLSQMAKPYVDNWLRTRQSVADIVNAFSVFVLQTDMAQALGMDGDGDGLFKRAELFNNLRDNRGLMVLDKDRESFTNVAAPLGSLDKLQAQSQEHMAAVSGIPLVKLTGITPSGLNASSEGELECFETWIHAYQEALFTDALTRILGFIQLSEFGKVDPDIHFKWVPLGQLDEKEQAEVRRTDAETGKILIESKAISPAEERARVAADPDTPYTSLDPKTAPTEPLTARDKAEIAVGITNAVATIGDLVPAHVALAELKKSSEVTGVWSTITDADITDAIDDPPAPETDLDPSDPLGAGTPPAGNGQGQPDPGGEAGLRQGEAD